MKATFLAIALFFFSLPEKIIIEKELDLSADFIETDIYGFLYVAKGNAIHKYNTYGIKLGTFQSPANEKITSFDVSNPLKILVYYNSLNKVRFLDSKLNAISGDILLDNFNINSAELVCSSNEDGFWVVNTTAGILIKFNSQYKPEFERTIFDFGDKNPSYMTDFNGKLYVNFPGKGIVIFDYSGIYDKTIEIEDTDRFGVMKNKIYYYSKSTNKIKFVNITNFIPEEISIESNIDCIDAKIVIKDIFIQTPEKILIGKLK
jgi:hypothetical protein